MPSPVNMINKLAGLISFASESAPATATVPDACRFPFDRLFQAARTGPLGRFERLHLGKVDADLFSVPGAKSSRGSDFFGFHIAYPIR